MAWYSQLGRDGDIALYTKTIFYRNVADYPFTKKLGKAELDEIISRVTPALSSNSGFDSLEIASLDKGELGGSLSKKQSDRRSPVVFENEEKGISVILGASDHITISCTSSGFDTAKAYDAARETDKLIDSSVSYAFSQKLGYLTADAENLGPAMTLLYSLFLPSMTAVGLIDAIRDKLALYGMLLTREYACGDIYKLVVKAPLGKSENEVICKANFILTGIISKEREVRAALEKEDKNILSDRIFRSEALIKSARILSFEEFMEYFSDIRLGVSLGIINDISYEKLGRLLLGADPSVIIPKEGESREEARADFVRQLLAS